MAETLGATEIIQKGDRVKFRNLYYYHVEKIKNAHLAREGSQNKVNEVFSLTSKLAKQLDPKTLTQKLGELVETANAGGLKRGLAASQEEELRDRERETVNNRFISDYQTNFVQPKRVKKRTATEIIGVDTETPKRSVDCPRDAEILLQLKGEVACLRKRSRPDACDKENQG